MELKEIPGYAVFQPRPDQPERYDMQTSFYNCMSKDVIFLLGGNGAGTTELALAKMAKFLLETPPPRHDCPVWVIANSYEMCCATAWKEKLYGHGHIPHSEVDWDRIQWFRPKAGWPYRVPLRPWAGRPGKNWLISFRSYEQGREQMQAQSIAGFVFIEQFPWPLLEEVMRGCREYSYPGSKIVEQTPVDPNMSIELDEMIEEGTLVEGENLFRCNTECALEAGHVTQEWFDAFYGLVSDEMRATRTTGHSAIFEGSIYKSFNPLVHLVDDDVICHPPSVYYRRAIDWGAGVENPFCCLFAYKNGKGQFFVFDEYYSNNQEYNVIDHLCEVQKIWHWPTHNPHYGVAWADPSSPDDIRTAARFREYCPKDEDGEPAFENVPVQGASNSVIQGIYHVQYMLKPTVPVVGENGEKHLEPRLFIHKRNCPKLARQMKSYRWKKSSEIGTNPEDARVEPVKKNDHAVDALRYLLFSEAVHTGVTPSSMAKKKHSKERGVHLAGSR